MRRCNRFSLLMSCALLEAWPCRQKIRSAVDFQKLWYKLYEQHLYEGIFPRRGFLARLDGSLHLQVSFVLVSFKPTPASIVIFHECADCLLVALSQANLSLGFPSKLGLPEQIFQVCLGKSLGAR